MPPRSARNRRVVAAARLQRSRIRREEGRTLLEGPHLLSEALAAGAQLETVFALAGDGASAELAELHGLELVVVSEEGLGRLASTEHPRGPVAVLRLPEDRPPAGDAVVLVDLADPGNVGTVIRTAAAFGFDVVACGSTADLWSPKVLRAAAGAHFRVRLSHADAPPEGHLLVATLPAGGDPPEALAALRPAQPWAVLVGSEAHGLPPSWEERADATLTIPMPGGTESLNAAVAAALAMYEVSRARLGSGVGWRH